MTTQLTPGSKHHVWNILKHRFPSFPIAHAPMRHTALWIPSSVLRVPLWIMSVQKERQKERLKLRAKGVGLFLKFLYSFIAGVGLCWSIHSFHVIPCYSMLFHVIPCYSWGKLTAWVLLKLDWNHETSIKVAVALRDVANEVYWKRCHPNSDLVKGWYKYVQV